MIKVSLKEAEAHLAHLIEEAAGGQEVVIQGAAGSQVRLVPVAAKESGEPSRKQVGHALDRFVGTWSAEQEAEVLQAVEAFERVDESFWA